MPSDPQTNPADEDMICPFCGEAGFDRIGLRLHLIKWCEEFRDAE